MDGNNNNRIVLPIKTPCPVPRVTTVSIERARHESLGVTMLQKNINTVTVTGLQATSILLSNAAASSSSLSTAAVKVGDEILAINGEPIHNAKQAGQVIKASTQLQITLFDRTSDSNQMPFFCYMEVAPTSKINPGVSFDSCCTRTMVVISEVFLQNLQKTRLREGDIILAVNGEPVWKPEQADKVQLEAAQQSQALILYCVDMEAMRDYFSTKVQRTHLHLVQGGYCRRTAIIQKEERGQYVIREGHCQCIAKVNKSTQLLDDRSEWEHQYKRLNTGALVKSMMLDGLNHLMQAQLRVLKAKIVDHAWNYRIHYGENGDDDYNGTAPTTTASTIPYVVPSAPTAPVAIPIHPTNIDGTANSSGAVPIAMATLVVQSSPSGGEEEEEHTL